MKTLTRVIAQTVPVQSRMGQLLRRLYYRLQRSQLPEGVPRVLEAYAESRRSVVFVQIGSNDGGHGDPLRRYVLPRKWSGIVVEPQPEVFQRLQDRYRGCDRVHAECVAIGDTDGPRTLYFLQPSDEPDLPPWYDQLASFDRDHLVKHRKSLADIEQRIRERNVQCLRFQSLLAKNALDRFDLLHIDAEGYDAEILGQVDLSRFDPDIILYEHRHLSDQDAQACRRRLREHGYSLFVDRYDTIAAHPRQVDPGAPLADVWSHLPADGLAGGLN